MIFLVLIPTINIIIWIIAIIVTHKSGERLNVTETYFPDGKEYEETYSKLPPEYDSLASKVDTRLTNIFRNPWEDIL